MTPPRVSGFTLVELAIVLFVVTLLLGGVLTPLGQQIAERQNRDSLRALDNARTALVGYALGRRGLDQAGPLPCPDLRVAMPGGTANDGIEDRNADGRCLANHGNLPWLTLGLAETDAWGNRLGYAVAAEWAAATRPPPAGRHEGPTICPDTACARPMPAAAVILSHGRNGLGATNAAGGVNAPPISDDERRNAAGGPTFIQRPPRAADRAGGEFDDLLLPISPARLRGRLCDPASLC